MSFFSTLFALAVSQEADMPPKVARRRGANGDNNFLLEHLFWLLRELTTLIRLDAPQ
jgi:hypothetical protein